MALMTQAFERFTELRRPEDNHADVHGAEEFHLSEVRIDRNGPMSER